MTIIATKQWAIFKLINVHDTHKGAYDWSIESSDLWKRLKCVNFVSHFFHRGHLESSTEASIPANCSCLRHSTRFSMKQLIWHEIAYVFLLFLRSIRRVKRLRDKKKESKKGKNRDLSSRECFLSVNHTETINHFIKLTLVRRTIFISLLYFSAKVCINLSADAIKIVVCDRKSERAAIKRW